MRLTTKGRYAVTAMLDLAIHFENGPITLADISKRQDISLSYLEQLFAKLRRRGLVDSSRGPGGGYKLSRSASDIFVAEVITAVDEKVDARKCEGRGNCQNNTKCLTHDLWCDLSDQIFLFLNQINLEQLVQREQIQIVARRQDVAAAQKGDEETVVIAPPKPVRPRKNKNGCSTRMAAG